MIYCIGWCMSRQLVMTVNNVQYWTCPHACYLLYQIYTHALHTYGVLFVIVIPCLLLGCHVTFNMESVNVHTIFWKHIQIWLVLAWLYIIYCFANKFSNKQNPNGQQISSKQQKFGIAHVVLSKQKGTQTKWEWWFYWQVLLESIEICKMASTISGS